MKINAVFEKYDTGWISNSDWTDQQLGDTPGSNVNHNLNSHLSEVLVKVLISTDGTDSNAFEVYGSGGKYGPDTTGNFTIYEVDSDNIKVQTFSEGITYIDSNGDAVTISNESLYYKVVILY